MIRHPVATHQAGESHRARLVDLDPIGNDAVATFEDLDRPGVTYREILMAGDRPPGLTPGHEAVITYRPSRTPTRSFPGHWRVEWAAPAEREKGGPDTASQAYVDSYETVT